MNEAFMINLHGVDVYSGQRVRRGRNKVIFRRMVFEVEGDFAEVVDSAGRIHKCSPAELRNDG